ncbi:caspase family protein [Pseudonocardia kunmingensis]|uniref:Caspase domain-containing protein n=1 Tax=Pseudonocardia kunmingensis TaxID=630975 RepID=A0A543DIF8_9PSEU|nr:caspase family protein [Pseudonocardia kunmingensis]TQM09124.1 caspase domain-containing protein [Pseudonocardia kunmingensis]
MARGISIQIGINNVDPAVYGSPLTLRGCENDARSMRGLAEAAGFDMAASTMLLSPAATAGAVAGAIRAAAARLRGGDLLFLTYSGHGGQVPDPTGTELDAKNETWVLYDRQLLDDELNMLWSEFAPGVRIFVLSDSCHSGTVVRDVDGTLYDSTRRATLNALPVLTRDLGGLDLPQPVTRDLPFLVQARVYQDNKAFYDGIPRAKDVTAAASVLLISGCQDNQVSLDGSVNGLFTEKLLQVWRAGFSGDHPGFRDAIAALLPPTQSPNFYTTGAASLPFQRQRPLTVAAPVTAAAPVEHHAPAQPSGSTWMDRLRLEFGNIWKENGMTQSANGAQEKWLEFIPVVVDLGLQVVDALSKEGYQIENGSGQKLVATRDTAGGEKWLQFIPLAISVGAQVYDALSKEGALPPSKQVALPKDISAESTKGWLDLIPIVLNLGSQVLNAATKEGFVDSGNGSPMPSLEDPDAKGWMDLIPVALEIGTQIYNTLTKSTATTTGMPVRSLGDAAAGGPVAREVVASFGKQVLEAARM